MHIKSNIPDILKPKGEHILGVISNDCKVQDRMNISTVFN